MNLITNGDRESECVAEAMGIFQRLLTTARKSVGLPRDNTSKKAIEEGMRLNHAFLKIENPHARVLITELTLTIAKLTRAR